MGVDSEMRPDTRTVIGGGIPVEKEYMVVCPFCSTGIMVVHNRKRWGGKCGACGSYVSIHDKNVVVRRTEEIRAKGA